jgi:enoyl-CoA hydratase/carnithine racemase
MVLLGRALPAQRARELGLIAEVTPPGQALPCALRLAHELAALPAHALQAAKAALREGAGAPRPGV